MGVAISIAVCGRSASAEASASSSRRMAPPRHAAADHAGQRRRLEQSVLLGRWIQHGEVSE
jgi:hypothetical protein